MKRLLSLALVLCMLLSASASFAEDIALKVWGSQDDQAMLQEMVESFKAANEGKTYDITFGVVGEPDAKTKYLEDPEEAADVFAFANDQLYDLLSADALYEVTINKDAIVAANVPGSIEAASSGDHLYAYPMTADNGYFLYYDKSVISEEQVQTLDGILEAAQAAGKKMFMDVSNGWYIASFFLGAGGILGLDENGKQTCDFNNENGVAAGEAIKALTAHEAFLTGDDAILTGGMGTTIAAGVSGTWNADAIKEKLGDNYAATKLPTFTVNGEQVQMGSFAGFKLMGVNTMTMYPEEAMALAEFLTNEENQIKRFEVRAMGPSNINAAASEAVQANVALAALAEQAQFAVGQKDVLGNYWSPAEAFGTTMEAKDYAKDVKTLLDEMVAAITQ
ncbi:MAG: extracellular solute-binding protein [Eubacteriales bacterium]|nr:extracellular solute-binding protein [Eubacteriales bacterium]MDD4106239.1 extracellular solute-binding protein [Eubacteriales bacterium]MDD4711430.1 extracellular solute-binding protein [Eubacteriales bacterium]NLO16517.1 extracellular solute-binding protein [Clostridiales bacterium]